MWHDFRSSWEQCQRYYAWTSEKLGARLICWTRQRSRVKTNMDHLFQEVTMNLHGTNITAFRKSKFVEVSMTIQNLQHLWEEGFASEEDIIRCSKSQRWSLKMHRSNWREAEKVGQNQEVEKSSRRLIFHRERKNKKIKSRGCVVRILLPSHKVLGSFLIRAPWASVF